MVILIISLFLMTILSILWLRFLMIWFLRIFLMASILTITNGDSALFAELPHPEGDLGTFQDLLGVNTW